MGVRFRAWRLTERETSMDVVKRVKWLRSRLTWR